MLSEKQWELTARWVCDACAQRSHEEIVARAESEVLRVPPSLVLGVLDSRSFITAAGGMYLLPGRLLSDLGSELTLIIKVFV